MGHPVAAKAQGDPFAAAKGAPLFFSLFIFFNLPMTFLYIFYIYIFFLNLCGDDVNHSYKTYVYFFLNLFEPCCMSLDASKQCIYAHYIHVFSMMHTSCTVCAYNIPTYCTCLVCCFHVCLRSATPLFLITGQTMSQLK